MGQKYKESVEIKWEDATVEDGVNTFIEGLSTVKISPLAL